MCDTIPLRWPYTFLMRLCCGCGKSCSYLGNLVTCSAALVPLPCAAEAHRWLVGCAVPLHLRMSPLLMHLQMLLDCSKEDLGSANAGVRNSAIHLLGVLHRCARCSWWLSCLCVSCVLYMCACMPYSQLGGALFMLHNRCTPAPVWLSFICLC